MENKTINAQDIHREVMNIAEEIKKMSLFIYDNPELGLQEHKACKAQVEILEKHGFDTEKNFCGLETAYKAVYKGAKSGPKITMLAEYDALPELGHGCGHNIIAMVSIGSCIAMKKYADIFGAEITVIGTPAEETAGAKVEMAKKGAFDTCDVVMMAHPLNENIDTMNTMAINARRFSFYGQTAHASAAPYEGKNALDAMINFFNMVNAMRQQTKEDARIHGIITKGGVAPNIIPDYTEAEFYIRAKKSAYLEELTDKVIDCAKGAAMGTGTRMECVRSEVDFKDTCSNLYLAELQSRSMEALGFKMKRMNGQSTPGSSDLGDVSYVCPAIQCAFDITDGKQYGVHTRDFAVCAGSEHGMQQALLVIEAFVMTGIKLMTDSTHLEKIKEEFSEIKK